MRYPHSKNRGAPGSCYQVVRPGCLLPPEPVYIWMGPLSLPLTKPESRISWKWVSGGAALLVLVAAGGVGVAEFERLYGSRPGRDDYDSSRRASALPRAGTPLSRFLDPAVNTGLRSPRATQEQRMLQLIGDEAKVRPGPHMTDRSNHQLRRWIFGHPRGDGMYTNFLYTAPPTCHCWRQ